MQAYSHHSAIHHHSSCLVVIGGVVLLLLDAQGRNDGVKHNGFMVNKPVCRSIQRNPIGGTALWRAILPLSFIIVHSFRSDFLYHWHRSHPTVSLFVIPIMLLPHAIQDVGLFCIILYAINHPERSLRMRLVACFTLITFRRVVWNGLYLAAQKTLFLHRNPINPSKFGCWYAILSIPIILLSRH